MMECPTTSMTLSGAADFPSSFKRPASVVSANHHNFFTPPRRPAASPSDLDSCFNNTNNNKSRLASWSTTNSQDESLLTMMMDRPASCGSLMHASAAAFWQHDPGDDQPFDGSLSCLSDLAAPAYASNVLEFVKRQSATSAAGQCAHTAAVEFGRGAGGQFQYILMAPTSAAMKLHEEPVTYLNQGQSYELKCKRLVFGDDQDDEEVADQKITTITSNGRLVKSVIRITFHDRRQKFQELELLSEWKKMHNDEKIIDADAPPSYGILNMKTDPMGTTLEFYWDTAKSTSIFIKVNCISTEFTARKRGGEKGVPFRLQVDTYNCADTANAAAGGGKKIHCSYALIKVFKTKGADRKNKADREKAEKRNEKYQPAFEFTILTEAPPVDAFDFDQCSAAVVPAATGCIHSVGNGTAGGLSAAADHASSPLISSSPDLKNCRKCRSSSPSSCGSSVSSHNHKKRLANCEDSFSPPCKNGKFYNNHHQDHHQNHYQQQQPLRMNASPEETIGWLRLHRFGDCAKSFSNFSGADLLSLHRDDLIQICGTSEGIRLFNALQQKKCHPKLTLYICAPDEPTFHCVFLFCLTVDELVGKLCALVDTDPSQVVGTYCQGPGGINVHVTDEVVDSLHDRSMYCVERMKCGDEQSDCYRFLLKLPGW